VFALQLAKLVNLLAVLRDAGIEFRDAAGGRV
jgi:hypothetical protein